MKTRADWLEQLRPLSQEDFDCERQEFESLCLYPLVELQESHIINYLSKAATSYDPLFGIVKPLEKIRSIKLVLENKASVRNIVLGMVLGLMRNEELDFFNKQNERFSKSIIRHVLERMRSKTYLMW